MFDGKEKFFKLRWNRARELEHIKVSVLREFQTAGAEHWNVQSSE